MKAWLRRSSLPHGESHIGTACRGVNWDRHSLSDLRAAVTCVGGPHLASLCRLLAQDYRSWSRGMPDLFLWRFSGDYKGEAKLVEGRAHATTFWNNRELGCFFLWTVASMLRCAK
ncbi:hypothetical protein MKW92_000720 [Papaver armeniacum]|nr:hypothetical protein MKW92_000720 [Papaver armeniacum]